MDPPATAEVNDEHVVPVRAEGPSEHGRDRASASVNAELVQQAGSQDRSGRECDGNASAGSECSAARTPQQVDRRMQQAQQAQQVEREAQQAQQAQLARQALSAPQFMFVPQAQAAQVLLAQPALLAPQAQQAQQAPQAAPPICGKCGKPADWRLHGFDAGSGMCGSCWGALLQSTGSDSDTSSDSGIMHLHMHSSSNGGIHPSFDYVAL
eukprot:g4752.t1